MPENTIEHTDGRYPLLAARIREELARRRMSRQLLADEARISLSTLEKALRGHGRVPLATLVRLENALGIRLRGPDGPAFRNQASDFAPRDLGGYSRSSVAWLEGRYVTLRPSFSDADAIFAYCTDIGWSSDLSCLVFHESDRLDRSFTHEGPVSVPGLSDHVYLATNVSGQHRLIIASRPAINGGEMYGVMTTLKSGRGASLTPVATTMVFVPEAAVGRIEYGLLPKGHKCWAEYAAYLRKAADGTRVAFLPEGS